ncbi:MAG TPA: hypothetical protein ENK18_23230 [Deltaproteobacteria bacterium]|nr:hypothetical protein [Deltaproteobacteria bacterium]
MPPDQELGLATWDEVQQRVRSQFQLDADEPDTFTLTVPRQAQGAREQRVTAYRYAAWDREMIELRSAFGELEEGRGAELPAELLAEGLRLPLGVVSVDGRFLVVVHKACLEHLSVEGVVFLLTRICLLADTLEERTGYDRF